LERPYCLPWRAAPSRLRYDGSQSRQSNSGRPLNSIVRPHGYFSRTVRKCVPVKLNELAKSVFEHRGEFDCEEIHNETNTRVVQFQHALTPPEPASDLPAIGRLSDFYETFGSITFYVDPVSGDAARFLAGPSQWPALMADFGGWFDDMDESERQEYLPDWVDSCLVIGETPSSGNYVLMATHGDVAGKVFEFDHDGFEFVEQAKDIIEYAEKMLNPDAIRLTDFASHMRFIDEGQSRSQWWIRTLRDNRGNRVDTRA